jgi:hypothetical protein
MDYHRQFRAQQTKPPGFQLQPPFRSALPARHTPLPLRRCSSGDPRRQKQNKPNVRLQAQIKELHFWLKVFSRFCQNKTERE